MKLYKTIRRILAIVSDLLLVALLSVLLWAVKEFIQYFPLIIETL